jgi:hypothetical protein
MECWKITRRALQAAFGGGAPVDDAEDVAFLHDQQLFAVERDLGAGPLAEQDAVAGLDVHRDQLAVCPCGRLRAHGDDFAFGGLFLGAVGDDQAARSSRRFDAADQHTVMQRFECHSSGRGT